MRLNLSGYRLSSGLPGAGLITAETMIVSAMIFPRPSAVLMFA
jgi:hypothetical protein